jgi:hypothetical protein
MIVLTLLPFLLGVIAETTKPNTGDQTLGASTLFIMNQESLKELTCRIHIRIRNLLPHSAHYTLMSRPTPRYSYYSPRYLGSRRYGGTIQYVVPHQ